MQNSEACLLFAIVAGCFLISEWIVIYNIRQRKKCSVSVQAFYKGVIRHRVYNTFRETYQIQFCYEYNGKEYVSRTLDQRRKKEIGRFLKEEPFYIYVNPEHPEKMCITMKAQTREIFWLIVFGIIILANIFFLVAVSFT